MRFYKIIIGNSRNMTEVKDNSVDFIVTSPPYWLRSVYTTKESDELQGDISRIEDRKTFFYELGKVWRECYRVLKAGRYIAVNFQDVPLGSRMVGFPRQYCVAGDYTKSIEDVGFYLINQWIWRKYEAATLVNKAKYAIYENPTSKDIRAIMNWEYVFIFKKPNGSRTRFLDFTKNEWMEWSDGVWRIESVKSNEEMGELATEAAIYPVEIPRRLIKMYSSPKDVVLDPFLGSGTTMLAGKETLRSVIGYEIRKEMLEIIKQKVGFNQMDLSGEDIKWEVKE